MGEMYAGELAITKSSRIRVAEAWEKLFKRSISIFVSGVCDGSSIEGLRCTLAVSSRDRNPVPNCQSKRFGVCQRSLLIVQDPQTHHGRLTWKFPNCVEPIFAYGAGRGWLPGGRGQFEI